MDFWDALLAGATVLLSSALAVVGAAATWMSRSIIRHDQDIAVLSAKLSEYQTTNAERLSSMEENNAARHREVREDLQMLSSRMSSLQTLRSEA